MQSISTIGLDIGKSVFQVHGVDDAGEVVIRRQLKRRYVLAFFQKLPPCLVGIEACASSHYWSRELKAFGHTVRLMPPAYVKALRQTTEERCYGRRGDLRSCKAADDAVRRDQDAGAAELLDAPSHPSSRRSPVECGHQCATRPSF
jgi:transposase